MPRWRRLLRHEWPLHLVLLATNWLPDNVIFLRLRGVFARPFLGKCGLDLRLGRNITFYNASNIELGSHIYLAYGCILIAGVQPIVIHDEVIIGPYCVLASDNHASQAGSFRYGVPDSARIEVGSGAWLGAHAVVTAGCAIGKGSLVGAGAVVIEDVPDRVLAGGVPSHIIGPLGDE